MAQLRQRMQEDLQLRNFSQRTIRHYTPTPSLSLPSTSRKSPDELGPGHIRAWLLYLLNERKLAWGTIQGARSALKFLYTRTLKQTWFDQEIIKPKVRRRAAGTVKQKCALCSMARRTPSTAHCWPCYLQCWAALSGSAGSEGHRHRQQAT